jgi:hypothetical protein
VATSLSQDGAHVDPAATATTLAGEDMLAVAIRLADAADLACLIVEEEEEGNEWLAKDVANAVQAMEDDLDAEAHGAENARPSNTDAAGPSQFQQARSTDGERKTKKRKKEEHARVGSAVACRKTFAARHRAVMQLISRKGASVEEQCDDILAHFRESIDKTEGVVLSRFYSKLHESPEQNKMAIAALVNSTHFHDLKAAVIDASNDKEMPRKRQCALFKVGKYTDKSWTSLKNCMKPWVDLDAASTIRIYMKKNYVPDPNSTAQGFDFVYMPSDDPDDPDSMPCGAKVTNFIETTLVPQCTYEMNKLDGVRLDLFLQKAILRMANVDLSAVPPNLSIEGVQGFVPVDVTHAADNLGNGAHTCLPIPELLRVTFPAKAVNSTVGRAFSLLLARASSRPAIFSQQKHAS